MSIFVRLALGNCQAKQQANIKYKEVTCDRDNATGVEENTSQRLGTRKHAAEKHAKGNTKTIMQEPRNMNRMLTKINNRLSSWKHRWLVLYSAIVLAMGLSYLSAQRIIIDQSSSFTTVISNITLSLILLFGMWGIISDKMTKRLPKWAGWAIFFVGLFCMVMFLTKGAGFETRFR